MKTWKCSECFRERETEDDIILSICKGCLNSMDLKKGDGDDGRTD